MPDETERVRPLRESGTPARHPSPPRLALLLTILGVGALAGWGFSSLGDVAPESTGAAAAVDTESQMPTDPTVPSPTVSVSIDWQQATSVPSIPNGYDYAGATRPVEFGDRLYLIVRFRDIQSQEIRNELWTSDTGRSWQSEPVSLGQPVEIVGLAAVEEGLVISGIGDSSYSLWRSGGGTSIDARSWDLVDIAIPTGFDVTYQTLTTSSDGDVTATIIADTNLWREVVAPHVPEGVDPYDPDIMLWPTELRLADGQQSIPLFAEEPEVVTTSDSVWVRLVTLDGEESVIVYDLPPGTYPVEATPNLSRILVTSSWFSTEDMDFLPVQTENAVPEGYFFAEPWGDGFIAAGYAEEASFAPFETIRIWQSNSGRAWQPAAIQPPSECAQSFAVSTGSRLLLTTGAGTNCLLTIDGKWDVYATADTARYVIGGSSGFISYPDGFDYAAARFSADGETWTPLDVPAAEPYPTLVPLEDRLFMLSVDPGRPDVPKQIELWLGELR